MNTATRAQKRFGAVDEIDLHVQGVLSVTHNSSFRDDVVSDLRLIDPYVSRLKWALLRDYKPNPVESLILGSALSVFKHTARIALDLKPSGEKYNIRQERIDRMFDLLEEMTEEMWLIAESTEETMGESLRLRSLIHQVPTLVEQLARIESEIAEQLPERGQVRRALSPDLRADVWDKTRGRCWYCGVDMHPFRNYHVDHFIPVIDGGTNEFSNLVPSCQSCNSRKHARPAEYLRRFIASGKFYGEGME